MRAARKLVELYRQAGARGLVTAAARLTSSRIGATVYARHTELLIVKSLDREPRRYETNGLHVRPITAQHLPAIRRLNAIHREGKSASAGGYLGNDFKGFAIFSGDELIGYWWWVGNEIAPARTHPCVHRFELRLGDDEVYGFDYFIVPGHREHGAAMRALSLIYRELFRMRYRTVWAFVDADNVAARWVYNAHGNKVVRRIVAHEVFSTFLVQDRRLFVRNGKRGATHVFDYRLLFSLRPRERA